MVFRRCQFIGILTEALALCLYECLHELVAQVAVADSDSTGLPEQGGIAVPLEAEKALGCTEVHLLRLPSGKDGLHYRLELLADSSGLGDEVFGAVGAVLSRRRRQLLLDTGVIVAAVRALMGRDTFA